MIRRYWWLAGLALAALVVVVLAPLASSDPDGLERVAIDAGFAEQGTAAAYEILPDYSVPILGDGPLSLVLAGLIGILAIVAAVWFIGRLLTRRAQPTD
jgi:cobalt/nickel transport system permease protein